MTAPALSRTTRGGGRVYVWGDREYPSVTTILGATVPKPALVGWAAKATAEWAVDHHAEWRDLTDRRATVDLLKGAPFRDRDNAADVGTAVHAYAEATAKGHASFIPPEVEPFVAGFERFVCDWRPEYLETEATVFGDGYAGTLDAIARIDGQVVLLATKTTRSGVYPEVALQLAAYWSADFIGRNDGATEDPMPEMYAAMVLHLRPEGYRLVPVRVDDHTHRQWRRLVETFEYLRGPHTTAIGADLTPGGIR